MVETSEVKGLIKGLSMKDYQKKYRNDNKLRIRKNAKIYYENNKDKVRKGNKKYYLNNKKEINKRRRLYYQKRNRRLSTHKKKHPEEYINIFGEKVYTNGDTKEIKKQLPLIIDLKIKEMLR